MLISANSFAALCYTSLHCSALHCKSLYRTSQHFPKLQCHILHHGCGGGVLMLVRYHPLLHHLRPQYLVNYSLADLSRIIKSFWLLDNFTNWPPSWPSDQGHSSVCSSLALYLHYDDRRDIRWNIAWTLGKSRRLSQKDFPRAQAIFHRISRLES